MLLLLTVLFVALLFTYTNGFHDTANAIATVVGTKVLTPRQAILLASVTNLIGAFFGAAVAKTISSGLVEAEFISSGVLVCALTGAVAWNFLTWYFGMPSSSSHALVGGLCGAALASSRGDWSAIKWVEIKTKTIQVLDPATGDMVASTVTSKAGILYKVVAPMVASPIAGFTIGLLVMTALYFFLARWKPITVGRVFGKLQLMSSAYMGFSHGMNDATKCMGIITLALVAATNAHIFDNLPGVLAFLKTPEGTPAGFQTVGDWIMSHLPHGLQFGYHPSSPSLTDQHIPPWVTVVSALTMAAGTAAGGWRIIKTLGHKMVKLQPVHGFAAETTGATVLAVAASMGMPVSTTHTITTSIMGVGCAKRFSALKLNVVERIIWAWIMTLPATGGVAFLMVWFAQAVGWLP